MLSTAIVARLAKAGTKAVRLLSPLCGCKDEEVFESLSPYQNDLREFVQ